MNGCPIAERRLVIVTGKGGTGKSTITAALALRAASRGRRTLIATMDQTPRTHPGLGAGKVERAAGVQRLGEGLYGAAIDSDRVLLEWLSNIGGRLPARLLAARSSFRIFAAAAPGARELLTLVHLMELSAGAPAGAFDTVILDAPASGHALALLRAPATFAAIARVGPIAARAEELHALLADEQSTALLAVTHGAEMAIGETLELAAAVERAIGRPPDLAVVNAAAPGRFSAAELRRAAALDNDAEVAAALAAAALMRERLARERSQVRRLRAAGLRTARVPFLPAGADDMTALRHIAKQLARSRLI